MTAVDPATTGLQIALAQRMSSRRGVADTASFRAHLDQLVVRLRHAEVVTTVAEYWTCSTDATRLKSYLTDITLPRPDCGQCGEIDALSMCDELDLIVTFVCRTMIAAATHESNRLSRAALADLQVPALGRHRCATVVSHVCFWTRPSAHSPVPDTVTVQEATFLDVCAPPGIYALPHDPDMGRQMDMDTT